MGKPIVAIMSQPSGVKQLMDWKIVSAVCKKGICMVARYTVNKRTLRKMLNKHLKEKG